MENLPVVGDDLEKAGAADKVRQWIEDLPDRLKGDDTPLGEAAVRVADGFIVAFFTLLVTISLLLDGERLVRGVRRLFPPARRRPGRPHRPPGLRDRGPLRGRIGAGGGHRRGQRAGRGAGPRRAADAAAGAVGGHLRPRPPDRGAPPAASRSSCSASPRGSPPG